MHRRPQHPDDLPAYRVPSQLLRNAHHHALAGAAPQRTPYQPSEAFERSLYREHCFPSVTAQIHALEDLEAEQETTP